MYQIDEFVADIGNVEYTADPTKIRVKSRDRYAVSPLLKQMLEGKWRKPGVWNMEQFDPDGFMADLNSHGLPWQFIELTPDQAGELRVL